MAKSVKAHTFVFMPVQSTDVQGITPKEYIERFLVDLPEEYRFQNTPLQVYRLSSLASHLKAPTPLLKPQFNFLVHLTEGKFSQQIGTEVVNIQAPAILIVTHSFATALKKVSAASKGYFILIENKALNLLFSENELLSFFAVDPVLKLSKEDNEWLNSLHSLIYTELSGNHPDRGTASTLFKASLYKIIALSANNNSMTTGQAIALKFKQLAYKHYIEHKDVGFYATEVGVSKNYLNRCVKSVLGKTVKQVILEICILQSQLLLQDMTSDVSEVANKLNFEDPSYWGRLFKKITGQTPGEYKKHSCTISPNNRLFCTK